MYEDIKVSDWIGKTIVDISAEVGGECVSITFDDGNRYQMYHNQDCWGS